MIQEVFKTIRTIKPFFLLIIFITLSALVYAEDGKLLTNPISWESLLIPIIACVSSGLAWIWVGFIIKMSFLLPRDDMADLGYLVACSLFSFCLLITFSYFANNGTDLSFSILGKPEFIYTTTLYIMSLVAFETAGR